MKKLIFIFVFTLATIFAQSQSAKFSINGNTILNPNFLSYSINPFYEVYLDKHWNIHYSLGLGVCDNNKFYIHLSCLAPLGILFLSDLDDSSDFIQYLGIILVLLPEGVSYDIPLNKKWVIAPFININSAECFMSSLKGDFNYLLSADAGITIRYYFSDKFYGQIYSSAKIISSKSWGINSGLGFGFTCN